MKVKKNIDICTEKGKKEIFTALSSFKTKREAYEYLGVSGNANGILYLKKVADSVGFNLETYCHRRKRKCEECGKIFFPKRKTQRFCSSSCAVKNSNKKRGTQTDSTKEKISESLRKYYSNLNHKDAEHRTFFGKKVRVLRSKCPICGSRDCERKGICCHTKAFFNSLSYFGFDDSKLGTEGVFEEYEKVKNILTKEYFENKMSPNDMKKKYNYPKTYENITHLLKSMGIRTRNLSESQINALITGNSSLPNCYDNSGLHFHNGYHTTWDGKTVYYRSGEELKYALWLDNNKIPYNLEDLRIKYYDSQKKHMRIAIPDFHLTRTNEIVEVKSKATFNKQNMIDKFAEYSKQGYVPKLFYEGKIYNMDEIMDIDEYKFLIC